MDERSTPLKYQIVEDTDTEDFRYDPDERFSAMACIAEDGQPAAPALGPFATRKEAERAVESRGGIVVS